MLSKAAERSNIQYPSTTNGVSVSGSLMETLLTSKLPIIIKEQSYVDT
jgi:hypothetical protein